MRVNEVTLAGRLGQDPRLNSLPSGAPVVEFTLATDESYKTREGTKVERAEWHRIKIYGPPAEFAAKYFTKGQEVYVRGHLRTRSWEDKDKVKRFTTEVVVSGPRDYIQAVQWRDPKENPPTQAADAGDEPYTDVPF